MIYLEAAETKTGKPMDLVLAPAMTPTLRDYLDHWRPVLPRRRSDDTALWLTLHGRQPDLATGHRAFQRVTLALLGRPFNPHSVRHTMATTFLAMEPMALRAAGAALGHVDGRSVNEVYDHAGAAGAHRIWKKMLGRRLAQGPEDETLDSLR